MQNTGIIFRVFILHIAFLLSLFANIPDYSKINTLTPGRYKVSYSVSDEYNKTTVLYRTIDIKENKRPVINLSGPSVLYIQNGDKFIDPGFSASDVEDGDLSNKVLVLRENLDTLVDGTYTISYRVTDSYNQTTTVSRTVIVTSDAIRETVLIPGTASSVNLWDYMVNLTPETVLVPKYVDNAFVEHSMMFNDLGNDGSYRIAFDYTLNDVLYSKNRDANENDFTISIMNGLDSYDSIGVKKTVSLGEPITIKNPLNENNVCSVVAQYNKVSLAQIEYDDVIKLTCGDYLEAYYQKNNGLILENTLTKKNENLLNQSVALLRSDLKEEAEETLKNHSLWFDDEIKPGLSYGRGHNLTTLNYAAAEKLNVDKLWSAPYNLNGEGVNVAIVDGGAIRDTHQEFANGQIVFNETPDNGYYTSHGTHVAGTIVATGIKKEAHGFANQASLYAISYSNMSFGNAVRHLIEDDGVFISNHSYGFVGAVDVGEYDYYASDVDRVVTEYNEAIVVKSSGNDRGDTENFPYYGNIKGFGNAKNIFTIGSIDEDNIISSFSSVGPAENGRIKPDFVSKGFFLYSTDASADDAYMYKAGTSMAAPGFTGAAVLIEQRYNQLMGKNMRADLLKSLVANTSIDLGRKGPDYEYGFGLVNALSAVNTLNTINTDASLIQDRTLSVEYYHQYRLTIDKETEFKATLSWIDPTDDSINSSLYTNLDISIEDTDGNVFYPFSLDGRQGHEEDLATNIGPNNVDNTEQIVASLKPGTYVVKVAPIWMLNSSVQKYSLVSNIPLGEPEEVSLYQPINEVETAILKTVQN